MPCVKVRRFAFPLSTAEGWDERYRTGNAPWQSTQPSSELVQVVEEGVAPCAAIEFGCGPGTDAIWLARRGFDVTAVDLSTFILERARARSAEAGASIRFIAADVLEPPNLGGPYDFVFDRGCYHFVRDLGLQAYLHTLRQFTRPGSLALFLAGNANEPPSGPPVLTEDQIRVELGAVFEIVRLRAFRFESDTEPRGWLGWSCFARRA